MLATYIGAPSSGKTTTSARVFADLKERGMSVEFLSEYARLYIAHKRRMEGDTFEGLTNLDQVDILFEQAKNEDIITSDPKLLVVADSCAMSALLYMTDEYIERVKKKPDFEWVGGKNPITLARECAKRYDVVFRCAPVRPGVQYDPNRIHNFEQSLEIDKRIDMVLDLCEVPRSKVYPLIGDPRMRVSESHGVLMPKLVEFLMEQK